MRTVLAVRRRVGRQVEREHGASVGGVGDGTVAVSTSSSTEVVVNEEATLEDVDQGDQGDRQTT